HAPPQTEPSTMAMTGSGQSWILRSKHAWVPSAGAVVVIALGALTVIRLPLWSEDLKLFAATLATNPDSWKAKHNYASALDDRGRTAEGETLMREVIARRPDSAEAYNDIGVMLWKLGRREEAAQATQRALELRPTPGAAKNLATMQAELGNQAGQIDALRRALEMDPDDLLRTQQLAWALATSQDAQLRNGEEALGLAQKVINGGAVTPQAVIVLVAAQAETGQYESAKSNALALAQQLESAGDPLAETVKRDVLAPVQSGRPIRGTAKQ
ncbi:MAG: tetratricopeptide repeat protein, partial [Chthoniobacterales bacterium]